MRTALLVVIVSVTLEGSGALLLALDRALAIVAWPLIVFGLLGLFQAVAIAFGRVDPREHEPRQPERDDRPA